MENQASLVLRQPQENVFLIDWLTVVFHDQTVHGVKLLLGLAGHDIPWQDKHSFVYGYPVTTFWNNISIRWGADNEKFYSDDPDKKAAEKVRFDMGICLEMSGQGCRSFEEHGLGDWLKLLHDITECYGRVSITRLDLAYDDHFGLLDIYRIEQDARDRNLVCKARKVRTTWSDDWDEDIQGLTVEVGSRQSDVLVRIYNKAAERGYDHSKHWIRVELQLRKERANVAVLEILKLKHVGRTASGILRNYCTFRSPTNDSNRCRWPVADYWEKMLYSMDKISIWISPGEPYNFSKTQHHLVLQYGQVIIALFQMHGTGAMMDLLLECKQRHPKLKAKYQREVDDYKLLIAERKRCAEEARRNYGFKVLDDDDPLCQIDFAELFGEDLQYET